jgi:hypothetical protein
MPERVKVQGDLFHGVIPLQDDGRSAVYVGRAAPGLPASPYANPFKVGEQIERDSDLWPYVLDIFPGAADPVLPGVGLASVSLQRAEDCVTAFSWWVLAQPGLMLNMVADLAGRDLACWCKIGRPCHADDLLELAAELASTPDPEPYWER